MSTLLTDYEIRRLEKIKRNAALLQDLGLEHNKLKRKQPSASTSASDPKAKKLKVSRPQPSLPPTRVSARIASAPKRPTYNEDAAAAGAVAGSGPKDADHKPRSKAVSRKNPALHSTTDPDPPAASSPQSQESLASLMQNWTSWTPAAVTTPTRASNGTFHFPSHPGFTPNKSPSEMLREGVFGGSYFRPLFSKVLSTTIRDDWKELPDEWIAGLDVDRYLLQTEYDAAVNKYGVKCGQSIEEWEAAGWIRHDFDVRGWFQWYTRFFRGRRCEDDERQVGRWSRCVGTRGRFRRGLLRGYLRNGIRDVNDEGGDEGGAESSPVVHQTCLHWAWELKQYVLDETWEQGL